MPKAQCTFTIQFDFDFHEGEFNCQHEILDFIKEESKYAIETFTDDIGISKCHMTCNVGEIEPGGRFD